jgi:hypothetical protein
MRRSRVRIFIGLLLVTPALALAAPAATPLAGVWTGSIGKQAVTVCFNGFFYGTGNYYYHRYLSPIRLVSSGAEPGGKWSEWKEENGTWRLHGDPQSGTIEGTWISPDPSRTLPIKLTRGAFEAREFKNGLDFSSDACASNAYNEALEFPRKPLFGPARTVNGVKYRKVAVNIVRPEKFCDYGQSLCMETVELLGNTPPVMAINEQMRKHSIPVPEFLLELSGCRRAELGRRGDDGVTAQEVRVSVIKRWLAVSRRYSSNCGGDRGHSSEYEYIWNLDTGEPEDLFSWFQGGESTRRGILGGGVLPEPLAEFVSTRIGAGGRDHLGPEDILRCYGDRGPNEYGYELQLFDGGIVFKAPSFEDGACGDSCEITFGELRPFLNEKGKAAAALFRKSGAKKKPKLE